MKLHFTAGFAALLAGFVFSNASAEKVPSNCFLLSDKPSCATSASCTWIEDANSMDGKLIKGYCRVRPEYGSVISDSRIKTKPQAVDPVVKKSDKVASSR